MIEARILTLITAVNRKARGISVKIISKNQWMKA